MSIHSLVVYTNKCVVYLTHTHTLYIHTTVHGVIQLTSKVEHCLCQTHLKMDAVRLHLLLHVVRGQGLTFDPSNQVPSRVPDCKSVKVRGQ